MKITYKLVGVKGNYHFTREHDNANLDTMYQDFRNEGYKGTFDKVQFFANSIPVKDNFKIFNENITALVYPKETGVKVVFKDIMEKISDLGPTPVSRESRSNSSLSSGRPATVVSESKVPAQDINKPIEFEPPTIEDDEMIQHNKEIIKTLMDEDFIALMRIYRNKPQLLSFARSYLNSGTVIDEASLKSKSESTGNNALSDAETKLMTELKEVFANLSIEVSDSNLLNCIKVFSGNSSLIFRYFYQKSLEK